MRILTADFFSSDLEATAKFYGSRLGFPVLNRDHDKIQFRAGYTTITFRHSPGSRPVYHFAFSVSLSRIDQTAEFLETRVQLLPFEGAKVIDFDAWSARAFYFHDNNGNILEMIGREESKNDQQGSVLPVVHGVCEVAIVSDDVKDLSDWINTTTGTTRYRKQPMHDNFGAIGDDQGLFILSTPGRHWFPTGIPAGKFPVRVTVDVNERRHTLHFNE